ncbi:hypothetical protein JZ751_004418 [Albula glossodonta]|uniref:Uncharacterized protein n=1 Tax=Albula glossodonta TaxID=121402 RepID=A0A8T2MQP9_9TELE|nr:hypothetical protein JZ751_004418 [Albula glossodonta]
MKGLSKQHRNFWRGLSLLGGGRNRTCSQGQDTVSLICLDCRGRCRALYLSREAGTAVGRASATASNTLCTNALHLQPSYRVTYAAFYNGQP